METRFWQIIFFGFCITFQNKQKNQFSHVTRGQNDYKNACFVQVLREKNKRKCCHLCLKILLHNSLLYIYLIIIIIIIIVNI